jgi:hydrogenase-4 component B
VLQGGSWQFTFDACARPSCPVLRASSPSAWRCFGFGAKAGLVPLHVWLPEAHPAAPSPVSALMSGVMLKTAVYGLLRVSFDLLPAPLGGGARWLLALGLFSALYGVVFAAVQSDMKRLLACSSIENIGIVFAGFGLTLLFHADGKGALAALSADGALYHCLNHAIFKSLLFLATGSVLHATGERNLGRLGGLIRRMPWTAWLALIGDAGDRRPAAAQRLRLRMAAAAGLPAHARPAAALHEHADAARRRCVALTAALAAYVMVKFYGVIFLGQMRDPALNQAHDCGWPERLGMLWLAAGCVLLGLLPAQVSLALTPVVRLLSGQTLVNDGNWLMLAPVSAERASYAPLIFFAVVAVVLAADVRLGAPDVSRPHSPQRPLGLRLS